MRLRSEVEAKLEAGMELQSKLKKKNAKLAR